MRRSAWIGLVPAASIVLAACGEAPRPAATTRPVAVRVMSAQYETVPSVIKAPGSIQPRSRIVLSSQINGFVRSVTVRAGDSVKAGQVLVTLDAREAESQQAAVRASIEEATAALDEARKGAQIASSALAAARAANELASATLGRYQKLFAARSATPQELDEVRARGDAASADLSAKETLVAAAQDRLRQAEARIAQANAQARRTEVILGWTVIAAPASGRVAERAVDPGSAIFPGSPLLVIETTSSPQVLADLPTEQSDLLRPGMDLEVHGADLKPHAKGRISEIIPVSSSASHTIRFKVDLPADCTASSGSFVKVSIPAGTRRALLVPLQAVRETGQLTGIFIVDSGSKARYRLVKVIPYDSTRVELLSGVEPGERIIVELGEQISDGVPVEVRL